MKKLIYLLIITIIISSFVMISCNDDISYIAGIEDGEQLDEDASVPFILYQNYPNPFNPSTTINYIAVRPVKLTLKVYSEDWQEVRTLVDQTVGPDQYAVQFDGKNSDGETLPSGEYFYTLEGEGLTLVRTMKLLK